MEPRNICQTEASTYTKPMPTINKLHRVQNQQLLLLLANKEKLCHQCGLLTNVSIALVYFQVE